MLKDKGEEWRGESIFTAFKNLLTLFKRHMKLQSANELFYICWAYIQIILVTKMLCQYIFQSHEQTGTYEYTKQLCSCITGAKKQYRKKITNTEKNTMAKIFYELANS